MEKFKNKILSVILAVPLLMFGIFSIVSISNYTYAERNNVIAEVVTESEAAAKVTNNDTVTYYDSINDAINNAPRDSIVALLKDDSLSGFRNKVITLDLNGKILNGNRANISYTNIKIIDSVGTGEINSGGIAFYSSVVTIESGKFESVMVVDNSNLNFVGGEVTKLYAVKNSITISGGVVGLIYVYDVSYIHLSGGKINQISFVSIAEDFSFIEIGYAYKNLDTNNFVKIADMTSGIKVEIVECPHNEFVDNVCEYCRYVCEHTGHYNNEGKCTVCGYTCTHEGHYNDEGVCEVCEYVCKHIDLDENNNCQECKNIIEVNISNNSTNQNYIKLSDAVNYIADGDTVKLYRNVALSNEIEFNANCIIDLNGCTISKFYVSLNSKIIVNDSVGNGRIAITSNSNNSQIQIRGDETTTFSIMLSINKVKMYSGKIEYLQIYNDKISNVLPDNYIFIIHNDSETRKMTREESNQNSYYEKGKYLTVEECTHDGVDSNFECIYCGTNLSVEESITALVKQLEKAKEDLQLAISEKEDISVVNEKVATLNNTILDIENKSKNYTDSQYETLKSQLEELISNSKTEAMNYADTAIEQAKTELKNMLDEKADVETVNTKISALNEAILNAEIASKAYADEKDNELSNTLLGNIETAKNDAINYAKEALEQARLELENMIDSKMDISEFNEKVTELNNAIDNIKTTSEAYADNKDLELKSELENKITTAKEDAISYANTALEQAKTQLLNTINEKIDIETYNEQVKRLNKAIENAEIASKAYADEKDTALKTELENKITESKTTLQEVNNAIIERLTKAENEIDNNSKGIKVLKITLIISICALVTAIAAGFALMFVYAKK